MNADLYRSTVKKYMELRHIRTKEQLRSHTTCGSNTTFLKYWNYPEKMPISLFEEIMRALNVPNEDKYEIF